MRAPFMQKSKSTVPRLKSVGIKAYPAFIAHISFAILWLIWFSNLFFYNCVCVTTSSGPLDRCPPKESR
jgi:hypothetical protein